MPVPFHNLIKNNYFLTASFKALPAVNFGVLAAGILITCPVLGLRPFLAFLFVTPKVPKPTMVTFCPFFKAALTASSVASKALVASALLRPAPDAIFSISSVFVMIFPPFYFIYCRKTFCDNTIKN